MPYTVNYHGYQMGSDKAKPIHSKMAAVHKNGPPVTKTVLMKFFVSKNVFSEFFDTSHFKMKSLKVFFMIELNLTGTTILKHCLGN